MAKQDFQEKDFLRRGREKDLQKYLENLIEKGAQWDCATHKILGKSLKKFWWSYDERSLT